MKNNLYHLKDLLVSQNAGEWGSDPIGADALPILRAGNIADEGWIDLEDVVCRTIAEPKRSKILLKSGDILLEKSGGTDTRPVGRVAYIETNLNAGFSNFLHCLRPNPLIIQPRYLFFVLMYWHSSGRAVALQTRTTGIRNLMFARYLSEPIRVPLMVQQICVSRILELSTSSLLKIDRLIAAKREQKRGLMQQLLTGKLRFPSFTEPWKTVRLGDVLKESRLLGTTGFTAKKITVKLYGRGVYAKQEKRTGSVNTRYFKRLSGQLIYSKLDFLNGAFGIVPDELDGFESTLDMPTFDIFSSANPHWLLALVGRRDFYQRFNDGAEGGRKAKRVDPSRFFDEVIQLPCRAEQDRIARLIIILGKEIELLEQQRAAFAAQRRGLMEKLLSGEIDIQNPKETAA